MVNNNLDKLEYNVILEKLSLFCKTYLGKDFAIKLTPSSNKTEVSKLLKETEEALNFMLRKGNIPMYEIADINVSIKSLESNIPLNAKALLEIANILKLCNNLKLYFKLDDIEDTLFPTLSPYFNNLYCNQGLENEILNSVIDENTISDKASTNLFSIRKEMKKLELNIRDSLNKIIHSKTYSNAVMEQIVTIRNDRFVIPIKEEFKGTVKGFVHDVSSSGSTLFIEPIQIFELNNSIQSLKVAENIEIEKILKDLSFKIIPYLAELQNNVNLIGIIDFIFAKANFAKSLNAICPIINDEKKINLINARHPLIDINKVVPIDINIGDKFSSLIITGPNTGGKTVTLKTVGLLTAMACSGMFIPANENSSIYVFDNIFADIGDEQSIEESLSTFSSHIVNIIDVLNIFTENSLILLDELGSGTDPIEGAALAISILKHFHEKGALTIATTHYHEIKNYALITDGFENASSGFDIKTLTPTYKLLIGVPGKSNAFEISKHLGLSSKILDNAKSFLTQDDINIEDLLKNIYDDKIKAENYKIEIEKNKLQIENLRKSLEKEKLSIVRQKEDDLEKAKHDAKNLFIDTKEKSNDIINDLNNLYDNLRFLETIDFDNWSDKKIVNYIKMHYDKNVLKEANSIRNNYNTSFDNFKNTNSKEVNDTSINFEDLQLGAKVKVNDFSEIATIISLPNKSGKLQIQISSAKMYINVNDIEKIIDNYQIKSSNNISKTSTFKTTKSKNISPEINVISENVDEACFTIDKYLDDCAISKLSPVRIVHGKGSRKTKRRNS